MHFSKKVSNVTIRKSGISPEKYIGKNFLSVSYILKFAKKKETINVGSFVSQNFLGHVFCDVKRIKKETRHVICHSL